MRFFSKKYWYRNQRVNDASPVTKYIEQCEGEISGEICSFLRSTETPEIEYVRNPLQDTGAG